ncbi:hypothetical protein GCM10022381_00190 [Leifsonia kafniensis]|uniref:Uncharacterized protein n=1 Tax=Leifsonia kafniensis TaxID=475957 RepID=A0ABP7JYS3_9MICO
MGDAAEFAAKSLGFGGSRVEPGEIENGEGGEHAAILSEHIWLARHVTTQPSNHGSFNTKRVNRAP